MISQCSNNECRKPFLYLNYGRVVRTIRQVGSTAVIQHFWLCGDCYVNYDFTVSGDGIVSCLRRKAPQIVSIKNYSWPKLAP